MYELVPLILRVSSPGLAGLNSNDFRGEFDIDLASVDSAGVPPVDPNGEVGAAAVCGVGKPAALSIPDFSAGDFPVAARAVLLAGVDSAKLFGAGGPLPVSYGLRVFSPAAAVAVEAVAVELAAAPLEALAPGDFSLWTSAFTGDIVLDGAAIASSWRPSGASFFFHHVQFILGNVPSRMDAQPLNNVASAATHSTPDKIRCIMDRPFVPKWISARQGD